ncbi:hypothetical protein HHK36_006534 [Tetracentron sinense]|uniref:Uncharacterized protein n=1 Tax=Tetracentron sinense TaxID=13715 RepID=A0A835DKE9_TETSI|nr:hypothetical protein HHK36_006534 [Tetracentron sinense]
MNRSSISTPSQAINVGFRGKESTKREKEFFDRENKSMDDFKFDDCIDHHGNNGVDAETLLLLESVQKDGYEWELVAQIVPSKSKLDCISKLIQLPFWRAYVGFNQWNWVESWNTNLKTIHCKVKHFKDLELMMAKEFAYIQELKEYLTMERIDVLWRVVNAGIFNL